MKKIVTLLYILTILTVIDLIATLFWIHGGWATEANPIMGFFLKHSSISFTLVKLSLSFSGIYILYSLRRRFKTMILKALLGLNLIYIGVCGYHVTGMLFLLGTTN